MEIKRKYGNLLFYCGAVKYLTSTDMETEKESSDMAFLDW